MRPKAPAPQSTASLKKSVSGGGKGRLLRLDSGKGGESKDREKRRGGDDRVQGTRPPPSL